VYGLTGFIIDVSIALTLAGVLALVQRSANRYQASRYPEMGPPPSGMAGRYTWGEIVALVVGSLMTLAVLAGDLFPS